MKMKLVITTSKETPMYVYKPLEGRHLIQLITNPQMTYPPKYHCDLCRGDGSRHWWGDHSDDRRPLLIDNISYLICIDCMGELVDITHTEWTFKYRLKSLRQCLKNRNGTLKPTQTINTIQKVQLYDEYTEMIFNIPIEEEQKTKQLLSQRMNS